MRVAFTGVSHWHTPFYTDPVAASPDCTIVGVADPSERSAAEVAARLGTAAFTDERQLCEVARPDVVFALGRHIDMPATAELLLSAGIPFAMEKPCGATVAQIEILQARAEALGAFAAVPFVYRLSRFCQLVTERSGGEELTYGMFRQIPGPARRYEDWGVAWNLDRRQAGGGCTLNLSIHFYDLLRVLAPSVPWTVTAATMSSAASGAGVEDFSATLLEAGGRRATVETGYLPSGPAGETLLSVTVGDSHYRWDGPRGEIVITSGDGQREVFETSTDQVAFYGSFVRDTLERVAGGQPPATGLADMAAAARMAEAAYRLAGDHDAMT